MNIYLTDEQYEEMLKEGSTRNGETLGWIYFKHDKSGFEVYCETNTKDGKTVITYTDANKGNDKFYADRELIEHFCEFGDRRVLTDVMNDCPNCDTPMIYRFNYCPKCGQILKWKAEE